jgi:predicted O-methyltransferase YrrM
MIDIEILPSAWTGHRKFAEWLVRQINPSVIVDLGVDYGYSTFCLANPKLGTVYGIDNFKGDIHTGIHSDAYETVMKVIKENNYSNIEIIKSDFDDVAKTWDKKIDLLHIDGLHTYEATKNNYETWSKFLHDDSIIIMHDTTSFESVKKVFDEIDFPNKFNFEHSSGLGVLSKNNAIIDKIKTIVGNHQK